MVSGSLKLMGDQLSIPYVSLLTIVACLVIMAGLTVFTSKSKMGKAMPVSYTHLDVYKRQERGLPSPGNSLILQNFRFVFGDS